MSSLVCTATAELVDENGIVLRKARANSWGQFSVALKEAVHTDLVVRCEDALPATSTNVPPLTPAPSPDASPSYDVGVVTVSGGAPVVSDMFVTPATIPAKFDRPMEGLPSDVRTSSASKIPRDEGAGFETEQLLVL
jgi:hypothetical protein